MIDPQPDVYERLLNKNVVSAFRRVANQQRVEVHKDRVEENNSLVEKSSYLINRASKKAFNKFNEAILDVLIGVRNQVPIPIPGYLKDVEVCNLVAHKKSTRNLDPDFGSDVEVILSRQLLSKYSRDPQKDWSGFTQGSMNIHLIDDDGVIMSDLMFKSPYVNQLAEVIRSIWQQEEELTVEALEEAK
jgi:hypothetical protein